MPRSKGEGDRGSALSQLSLLRCAKTLKSCGFRGGAARVLRKGMRRSRIVLPRYQFGRAPRGRVGHNRSEMRFSVGEAMQGICTVHLTRVGGFYGERVWALRILLSLKPVRWREPSRDAKPLSLLKLLCAYPARLRIQAAHPSPTSGELTRRCLRYRPVARALREALALNRRHRPNPGGSRISTALESNRLEATIEIAAGAPSTAAFFIKRLFLGGEARGSIAPALMAARHANYFLRPAVEDRCTARL